MCDPGDPHLCSTPLRRGEVAPYAGQLLSPALAIQLGQEADHCEERILLEVARTSSLAAVELDYARDLHRLDTEALARERDVYRSLWSSEGAWYESPALLVALSVAATLGAVYVATRVTRVELGR